MSDDTPHRDRFTLTTDFFEQHIVLLVPAPDTSRT
jgi:hypothetical protein